MFLQAIRCHSSFVLLSCCLAIFADVFFYGVLPPILPYVLPNPAGVPREQVQTWVAVIPAIYCASLVLVSPLAGYLSDKFATRRPLFLGAIVFQLVGVSLLIAGTSLGLRIAGVAIAGCSSGFPWASSLAMVLDATSEELIAQTMSYVGLSISCGVLLGPVLGGVLYDTVGHYGVWSACFALIAVDVMFRVLMVEPRVSTPKYNPQTDRIKYIETETEAGRQRSDSTYTASLSAPLLGQPLKSSWSSSQSLSILTLWRSPRFRFAIFATICLSLTVNSFDGTLPIYAKQLFGFSSRGSGLLYLALTVPAFSQPLIGWLVDRHGGRVIGPAAFALSVPTLVCLRFVDGNSTGQKFLLVVLLMIVGATLSAALPVYMAEVSYVVLDKKRETSGAGCGEKGAFAQAHSLWSAAYSIGCTIGPLWGGEIQQIAGWKAVTWTVALLCSVVALLAVVFTGWKRKEITDCEDGVESGRGEAV